MRGGGTILLVALVIAGAASGASAKEKMDVQVCGVSECTAVTQLEARITHRYAWVRAPAPMPFYTVRASIERGLTNPGLARTIVYVPQKGIWRVRLGKVHVWVDVPFANEPILRRSVRTLQPCPPTATWVCARRG
jgi:hypothetical protein